MKLVLPRTARPSLRWILPLTSRGQIGALVSWGQIRALTAGPLFALAAACVAEAPGPGPDHSVIPVPLHFELTAGDSVQVAHGVPIVFDDGDSEGRRIGEALAVLVGNSAESVPPVISSSEAGAGPAIVLTRGDANPELGPEGYTLTSADSGIVIRAASAAGLFYGTQTLRQLLPWFVEYQGAQDQPMWVPAVRIQDSPAYEWRGTMLDVSRHFFSPAEVKRLIDLAALYKINRLHLHLSDDQGWRIEIPGWPRLTDHGGSTQVGGGPGGFYTTQEYADIVAYAADRFVTVVPEIDLPGHTNAALASYPDLNCDGQARPLYTGIEVGFSAVCVDSEYTYRFIDDVVREISALTPGEYFHIGGDEVETLTPGEYASFMARVYDIVESHGKTVAAWDEVAFTSLKPGTLIQLWRPFWDTLDDPDADSASLAFAQRQAEEVGAAVSAGARVILSPADRIYLDMKYTDDTFLGLNWAGFNDVRDAYDWGDATWLASLPAGAVVGVEAPMWSETVATMADVEYLAFPRLAGVAELGWSPAEDRSWEEYKFRLAAHGPRWSALGVNFHRSALVPWPE